MLARAESAKVGTAVAPIAVGVTGHRAERLGADGLTGVRQAIELVFGACVAAAPVSGRQAFRLVTALADGTDSLAADAALALGWTLDTVLPFARSDYALDFGDAGELAAHAAHLAASRSILELPGDRSHVDDPIAYERAGRIVLDQCDILVAVWDAEPARGRGGAGQIVAEAVLADIPVIRIDPSGATLPTLLWDGLIEHDLGQQSVDTVARGDLSHLPALFRALTRESVAGPRVPFVRSRISVALAYPLLLAVMGVRRLRRGDFLRPDAAPATERMLRCLPDEGAFGQRMRDMLLPQFVAADVEASGAAQLFRSGYVANFALAALAVVLSLSGLLVSPEVKPPLVVLEFITISSILLLTHAGNRAGWHSRWLDNRELSERLRCLALTAQLGSLGLHGGAASRAPWIDGEIRRIARSIGLPSGCADAAFLGRVRDNLKSVLDDEAEYLVAEARRMHRLEHRLHILGTVLFVLTAILCALVLLTEGMAATGWLPELGKPFTLAMTAVSASLPAIGAAIYGIRMQGDFAGIAERNEALSQQLATLRHVVDQDKLSFDTLKLRVLRASELLVQDLVSWRATYHSRPLALPG